MVYQFAGAYGGQVTLSFDSADYQEPGYVLVLLFLKGKLILTKHEKRGWEVPGGTIEPGEMPIQAAIRETYEETGAELDGIEWIGQYVIVGEREQPMVKSIYAARVIKLHPLPPEFETEDVRICEEYPIPDQIKDDLTFSPIMRDSVYPYVIEQIERIQHPFARKT